MNYATWAKRPNTTKIFLFSMSAIQDDGMGGQNNKTYSFTNKRGGIIDDAALYYEDDIKTFPRYARKMQNIFSGQGEALISYGDMVLKNSPRKIGGAGAYEDLIDGTWLVEGQLITGKIGGEEIAFSEYKTFLTGYVKKIREGADRTIIVTIADMLTETVNKRKAAGAYAGKVHALIKTALTDSGLAYPGDFNTTLWTTFETDCDYDVSVTLAGPTTFWSYIQQLTAGLLVWYGIGRDGKFEIGQFKAPTVPDEVDSYDKFDLPGKLPQAKLEDVYWSVSIGWSAGTQTRSDSTIKDLYPYAKEGGTINTAITTQANADTEKDRRFNLSSVQRYTRPVVLKAPPFQRHLDHVVHLDLPDVSIDDPFKMIGLEDNISKGQCKVTLFN